MARTREAVTTRASPPPSKAKATTKEAWHFLLPGAPQLADALSRDLGMPHPTAVQRGAVPLIRGDQAADVVVSSTTGSGKTLAYLLPLFEMLHTSNGDKNRPRAIVVAPVLPDGTSCSKVLM